EYAFQGDWFRTGDKFSRDADGYFWYAGRTDDMMKCNGAWVSPIEVEEVLLKHRAVREVAVVGREDEHDLMKPMAYVVLRETVTAREELKQEIATFAKTHLPNYKCPRWIEFVSTLPRTATGKIQRFKLRER